MIRLKELVIRLLKSKIIQSFAIVGIIAVIQLVNNVILGRKLSKDDFGLYSFVFMNITQVLSVLLLFGQQSTIIRYFSSKNIEEYKWKKYLLKTLLYIIIPFFIASFVLKEFYNLNWFWFWMVILGSFFVAIRILITAFFRTVEKFNLAIFLQRSSPVIFIILLLTYYLISDKMDMSTVAILKLASFFVSVVFLIYLLTNWRSGKKEVDSEIYTGGIAFWELSITVVALTYIDSFFIVKMLDYSELALFSVVSAIMRIYEFANVSLMNIYPQRFSKSRDVDISGMIKLLLVIILGLGIFYLISADFILQILFDGKYSASFMLIVLFCIYGSVNILYVFPSSYLIGHSSKKELRQMLYVNLFSLVMKIVLIFSLIDFGLNGFLISGIISMSIRTTGGYYLALKK